MPQITFVFMTSSAATEKKVYFRFYKPAGGVSVLVPFDETKLILKSEKRGHKQLLNVRYLQDDGREVDLVFQTPKLPSPFKLDFPMAYGDAPTKRTYKQFCLSIPSGFESDAFADLLRRLDKAIIDAIFTGQDPESRKSKSRDAISNEYCGGSSSLIKTGTSDSGVQYPDRIKIKVPIRDGAMKTRFFDDTQQPILDEDLVVMHRAEAIVKFRLQSIWQVQNSYYPTLEAVQVQVFPSEENETEFNFACTDDNAMATDDPQDDGFVAFDVPEAIIFGDDKEKSTKRRRQ